MFDYIKGIVSAVSAKYITIENNNIGYIVHVANPYAFSIGTNVCVYIDTYIREDAYDLYGFISREERDLFIKLLSVKGIGPKGALAILASGDIDALNNAIMNGDAKYLQRFPGIGTKASSQIILDLRGKLVTSAPSNPKIENVKDALKSLGYNNAELKKLDKFLNDNIDLPLEELIKLSLKNML
ncbi:MAG: Holliday junction branch migration protein RuvA [Bacilli bacterium]|nr:Holliday junction branch migration protein RuvA [Bacilli bacterium]